MVSFKLTSLLAAAAFSLGVSALAVPGSDLSHISQSLNVRGLPEPVWLGSLDSSNPKASLSKRGRSKGSKSKGSKSKGFGGRLLKSLKSKTRKLSNNHTSEDQEPETQDRLDNEDQTTDQEPNDLDV